MKNTASQGPLQGIRVLDMTLFLSGPFGTQILGDLGAEVIKVETGSGDQTRALPPNFVDNESAYFLSVNRNKKSITVDYRKPEGRAIIEQLAAKCDIFVENQRPGGLAKHGITYEKLSALNPRLIWCSISGFGQDGPYKDRPAYDMIVQALSGGMSLTGEPQGKSVRAGIPLGDISAGMYGVIGILAALAQRERTGKGEYVDVAMLDCQVAMLSYQAAYFLHSGRVPGRQGSGHDSIPSYRSFTASDGRDVVVCANTDRMWNSLCEAVGRHDLRDDPRMQSRQGRYEHRHAIWAALEAAFRERTADEWLDILHQAEVPVGVVNTLDHSLQDPQVLHRDMVIEMKNTHGERVRVAGNPIKLSSLNGIDHQYPPKLGEHTQALLHDVLGFGPEEIAELQETNIISTGARG